MAFTEYRSADQALATLVRAPLSAERPAPDSVEGRLNAAAASTTAAPTASALPHEGHEVCLSLLNGEAPRLLEKANETLAADFRRALEEFESASSVILVWNQGSAPPSGRVEQVCLDFMAKEEARNFVFTCSCYETESSDGTWVWLGSASTLEPSSTDVGSRAVQQALLRLYVFRQIARALLTDDPDLLRRYEEELQWYETRMNEWKPATDERVPVFSDVKWDTSRPLSLDLSTFGADLVRRIPLPGGKSIEQLPAKIRFVMDRPSVGESPDSREVLVDEQEYVTLCQGLEASLRRVGPVRIVGRTFADRTGGHEYNCQLAGRRADWLRQNLQGIQNFWGVQQVTAIEILGCGDWEAPTDPIAPEFRAGVVRLEPA